MLVAEHRRPNPRQIERRAKPARRSLAFIKPKASAPKLHHPDVVKSKSKTPEQRRSRVLDLPISNGASPVASALGIRSGATLRGPHQLNMTFPDRQSKQDISTLLGIGHFYFALTRKLAAHTQGQASILGRIRRQRYSIFAMLSLLVISTGMATLAKGRLGYYNYRGLTVYAPFAIVVGLRFLLVALMRWKKSR
jgi:hypothetical protein